MFTSLKHRLASIAIAAGLTLSMLAGIEALATGEPPAALLATISATAKS